jgi:hypothetical protein
MLFIDSWLLMAEDKENKVPLSEKPKLSDPSEFAMDVTEKSTDEVDAYIEENLEIPDIVNEVSIIIWIVMCVG